MLTVKELLDICQRLIKHGKGDDCVIIRTTNPSVGRSSGASIKSVNPGFDWDKGRVLITTDEPLMKVVGTTQGCNGSDPKKYLLNVTFYAGSDDTEDTDKGCFLLSADKEITENEMTTIFRKVNELLDTFNEESSFPISYDLGLNINTLMKGVEIYTKGKIEVLCNNCGNIKIDNYYIIEQWQ